MSDAITIDGFSLTLDQVLEVAAGTRVALDGDARKRMDAARRTVETLATGDRAVYGVNTGFGLLADVRISPDKIEQLQYNLLRSHASGVGRPLDVPTARAAMLLRANVMATGHTGVRPVIVETLLAMLNEQVTPVIPKKGSVGASGDLAPLSHLALVLIGEGEAFFEGQRIPGLLALKRAGIRPVGLEAKEGLSLVNGTQVMTAIGVSALVEAERVVRAADIAGAMTVEVLLGTPRHFDPRITELRPHPGAIASAENLRILLADSAIAASHAESEHKVQDPYSLRCMPQVHGSVRDSLAHIRTVLATEVNAVTDNPLVFSDAGELLSCGNFHGQPVASALDYLAASLTTLASISERRTEQMVNPRESGLPPFLAEDPGLESGFMLPHVTAAALVAESRSLSHPVSTDTIPTSGGQEDHVSMGVTSALKARTNGLNCSRVLAIEMLTAARGLDLRLPLEPGLGVKAAHDYLGETHGRWNGDRPLGESIEQLAAVLRDGALEKALVKQGVSLH